MSKLALSLLSFSLLGLSVRYPDLGWLALIGFIPLLEAIWQERSLWKAAAYSSIAFVGAPLAGYEGIALHSWLGLLAVMFCIALLFTIPGAFLRVGYDTLGRRALLGFPFVWVAAEWMPSSTTTFSGFANSIVQIGYSQSQTPLLHLASVGGVPLVSLVVVGINVLLYSALRTQSFSSSPRHQIAALAAAGAAFGLPTVLPLVQNGQDRTLDRPIALVQVAPTPDEFLLGYHGALDELQTRYLEQTKKLLKLTPRPAVILWPESAVFGISQFNQGKVSNLLRDQLKALDLRDTTLLFGAATWLGQQEFNVVMSFTGNTRHPDAPFELMYAKYLLMPLTETSWATPGDQAGTLLDFPLPSSSSTAPVANARFTAAPFICIETLHPDLIRPLVEQGAELLFFPSSDMWAEHTRVGYMHYLTSIFRAVEFHRTVFLAAQYGPSAIIAPDGKVQAFLGQGQPGILTIKPQLSRMLTFYVQYGSGLRAAFLTIAGLCVVFVLVLKIRLEGVRSPTILPS